jgi:hypothetical protein
MKVKYVDLGELNSEIIWLDDIRTCIMFDFILFYDILILHCAGFHFALFHSNLPSY